MVVSLDAFRHLAPPATDGMILDGRWQVGPKIGSGGMAVVHRGTDLRLERPVAIKILHSHVAENAGARDRLAREAKAIAQLKHENVIGVYDYAIDDPDCTWLVTELVEGRSLKQHLDLVDRIIPEVAVMIMTELVRALRAAHRVGVIHRDVKPDNILLGKEGRPKLSDFGIARILGQQQMTTTGSLVGSPGYMSPEQADGQPVDHRSDLFTAGVVLYRMVTGTLPFRGATPIETIRRVVAGSYPDPVDLEPGCAGAVAGIIRRAMSTRLEDRYQTADEMLRDLLQVLHDAGLSATSEELPKYFAAPRQFEAALKPRLATELEARGRALLEAGEEHRAVDCFNRALSLDEGTHRTLDLVRELSRRRRGPSRARRLLGAAAAALGSMAVLVGAFITMDYFWPPEQSQEAMARIPPALEVPRPPVSEAWAAVPPAADRPSGEKPAVDKADVVRAEVPAAKASGAAVRPKKPSVRRARPKRPAPTVTEPTPAESPAGTLKIGTRRWATIFVDGERLGVAPDRSQYSIGPGAHTLRAVNPHCLPHEQTFTISSGETTRLRLSLDCP